MQLNSYGRLFLNFSEVSKHLVNNRIIMHPHPLFDRTLLEAIVKYSSYGKSEDFVFALKKDHKGGCFVSTPYPITHLNEGEYRF